MERGNRDEDTRTRDKGAISAKLGHRKAKAGAPGWKELILLDGDCDTVRASQTGRGNCTRGMLNQGKGWR